MVAEFEGKARGGDSLPDDRRPGFEGGVALWHDPPWRERECYGAGGVSDRPEACLLLARALQIADGNGCATPVNWQPREKAVVPPA